MAHAHNGQTGQRDAAYLAAIVLLIAASSLTDLGDALVPEGRLVGP
jgi:hypothetical protein